MWKFIIWYMYMAFSLICGGYFLYLWDGFCVVCFMSAYLGYGIANDRFKEYKIDENK